MFKEYDMPERFVQAARCGFKGVEHGDPYAWKAKDVARWLTDNGLVMVQILTPQDWAAGELGLVTMPGREADFRDAVKRGIDYAGEVGSELLHGLNSKTDDVVKRVTEATAGRGADLVVDMIGGPVINQNMQAAAVKGRIIDVGRMGGLKGEIDLDLHSLKRISLIGVTFRTRSIDEIQSIIRLMVADIWPDVTSGKVKLPITSAFPLEKIRDAYAYMRANTHVGKIVVMV